MMVWLDLETSALEPEVGQVLEIAAIATDDKLQEFERFHVVVRLDDDGMEEAVAQMHMQSGLYDLCVASSVSESDAEQLFCLWLEGVVGAGSKAYMAGSGVSHFDMRWVAHTMTKAMQWFEYAPVDVGVLRRSLREMGMNPPTLGRSSGETKAHRAMADVEAHLQEFRMIKDWLVKA